MNDPQLQVLCVLAYLQIRFTFLQPCISQPRASPIDFHLKRCVAQDRGRFIMHKLWLVCTKHWGHLHMFPCHDTVCGFVGYSEIPLTCTWGSESASCSFPVTHSALKHGSANRLSDLLGLMPSLVIGRSQRTVVSQHHVLGTSWSSQQLLQTYICYSNHPSYMIAY